MSSPVPITKIINFERNGEKIAIDLTFNTLFLCDYTIELREVNSNNNVQPFPVSGDNSNSQDDKYYLPAPAELNKGRKLWIFISIIDQNGTGGDYECSAIISQGKNAIGALTTGKKKLSQNSAQEIIVATLNS
jgi:hypothetical protein